MRIALIEVPHEHTPTIHWFDDRTALFHYALDEASRVGDAQPTDVDEAVSYLANDWNRHILIESAHHLHQVFYYHGHQTTHVHEMYNELAREFLSEEIKTDDP